MTDQGKPITLAAHTILPVETPPLQPGRLTLIDGKIHSLEPGPPQPTDLDLGHVAILPGFVNAHTHLDLPPLDFPANPPIDQLAWLESVVALRFKLSNEQVETQIAHGIDQLLRSGTTLIADISANGQSWNALADSSLRAIVFHELIGLRRDRALATSSAAFGWLANVQKSAIDPLHLRPGLSPHAPYSTVGWLYERTVSAAVPLSTHLAELPAELTLLESRSGPLRDFLQRINAWPDDWTPLSTRPADYLRKGTLKQADWLIAHGTYLDESDFWQLRPQAAPNHQRVAIAYCPRTTALFGHGPHPFAAMLERGIAVAIGTDSLASSPSLSVLDEIRFLHQRQPDLPPHLLVMMATLAGAWALRFDDAVGSLIPGKQADLAILALPDEPNSTDPYLPIVAHPTPVLATMIAGQWVHTLEHE